MKNRKIIASCMLALSLVGCTGFEAGNGGYTTAGGAGGAAVGALAGQIIGKDTKGTLIGAAVGSLLGMGWGAYKDNQARELKAALKGTQAEVRNDGNALVVNLPGGVTFASDSANISSGFYSALNGVAQTLIKYPETRIQINGYTDSTGGDAHNQELSQRRANSVAQYWQYDTARQIPQERTLSFADLIHSIERLFASFSPMANLAIKSEY